MTRLFVLEEISEVLIVLIRCSLVSHLRCWKEWTVWTWYSDEVSCGSEETQSFSDFFFEEYNLNYLISLKSFTSVALLNGITSTEDLLLG